MPIYAYKCDSCGYTKDVLQKISDAPLTVCPVCSNTTFSKQLTAAGFQLKGSGWYATDFKGSSNNASCAAAATNDSTSPSSSANADSSSDKPDASGGCATGCACH